MNKKEMLELVRRMPASATEEDLLQALLLRRQIAAARKSVDAGRVVPHEEVKRRVAKWRKSSGR